MDIYDPLIWTGLGFAIAAIQPLLFSRPRGRQRMVLAVSLLAALLGGTSAAAFVPMDGLDLTAVSALAAAVTALAAIHLLRIVDQIRAANH